MPNIISSTDRDKLSEAFGVSDRRYEQIAETIRTIMDKYPDIRYTQIAEQVSHRLDLTTNEVCLVGIMIGGFAKFEFMVSGIIQEVELNSNLMEREMAGRPVVNQMAHA